MPQSPQRSQAHANYAAHVFPATDFMVVSGANQGDPMTALDELCPGDVYHMLPDAQAKQLAVHDRSASAIGSGRFLRAGTHSPTVASGSEVGAQGDRISLDGRIRLMEPDGQIVEMLLIGVAGADSAFGELYVLPLEPIEPKVSYALIDANADAGEVQLADITPVAFTRGTMITLGSGAQCPIENLRVGDKVLTRDRGPQPVRWIGHRTVRAVGPYAPVVITKGTLANASDMIVSQFQRLFIYQTDPNERLANQAEVLVRARDLVENEAVFIRTGGFVDYFHLIFDAHEIIYAECTPTESLLVDERALGRLPDELARDMETALPSLSHKPHFGKEPDKARLRPERLQRRPRDT
ncbi:hypothetical protein ACMU_12650 [Actibacterium mucosum KCTC 23349]|uniref:Hedgehog/Intein (Hint) domain-containing protein n=1 Tax=Actibacterium mucosum KCTC 23349 TaxID=1454373 RepID=A0A037ZJ10_9RHOB|nr:Hint domain-containing protein [Actibacterium mucosum]KAJ55537.1 hypothetical protein ACMU_12650 [Actibacterium mucosum KCTC 23349]